MAKTVLHVWWMTGLLMLGAGCGSSGAPEITANLEDAAAIREDLQGGSVGGAAVVVQAEPTGFASITGSFKLAGDPPAREPLVVDKDVNVCKPGGQAVLAQTLVVDPATKGIQDVLIFLANKLPEDDPRWEHPSYAEHKNATLTGDRAFDQQDCIFLSHVFALRSTQSVEILNSDPIGHNTNIQPSTGRVTSFNQTIAAGGKTTWSPGGESPTPYPVSCSIHPWMSAYMISRDNPYFAVTKPDGSFEIANLPTGVELEFRIWQEKSDWIDGTVTLNGQSQAIKKGRFTLTLEPDTPIQLEFVLDTALFQ